MKLHDTLVVIVIGLGGCASVRTEFIKADPHLVSDEESICKLAANGLAEGQTARVVATYNSDHSHYAYLSSEGCGKDGILNVGNLDPVSEETVRNFYEAGEQRCANKGTPYLCVIEAKIDADIKIIYGQDGKLAAELLKVHEFSFIEPDS